MVRKLLAGAIVILVPLMVWADSISLGKAAQHKGKDGMPVQGTIKEYEGTYGVTTPPNSLVGITPMAQRTDVAGSAVTGDTPTLDTPNVGDWYGFVQNLPAGTYKCWGVLRTINMSTGQPNPPMNSNEIQGVVVAN